MKMSEDERQCLSESRGGSANVISIFSYCARRNFVEIYRFVINPLTINQNFISISFFVQKRIAKKTFGGGLSTSPWEGEG